MLRVSRASTRTAADVVSRPRKGLSVCSCAATRSFSMRQACVDGYRSARFHLYLSATDVRSRSGATLLVMVMSLGVLFRAPRFGVPLETPDLRLEHTVHGRRELRKTALHVAADVVDHLQLRAPVPGFERPGHCTGDGKRAERPETTLQDEHTGRLEVADDHVLHASGRHLLAE